MYEMMIEPLKTLAQSFAPWSVDVLLKSSLLLLVAFAAAFGARRRSAAERHLLWTVAVVAILLMPAFSWVTPRVGLALPTAWYAPIEVASLQEAPVPPVAPEAPAPPESPAPPEAPTASEAPAPPAPIDAAVPAEAPAAPEAPSPPEPPLVHQRTAAPPPLHELTPPPVDEPAPSVPSRPAHPSLDEETTEASVVPSPGDGSGAAGQYAGLPFGVALLGLWVLGVVVALGRILLGVGRLAWLARTAERIEEGPLRDETRRVARRLGLSTTPTILRHERHSVPMTWGTRHAYLLLPHGMESWPAQTREAVLLHELGHVRRRDWLTQLAADLACALYWFHPLVWLAAHRMRIERELACDDVVVTAGHEPARYAEELLQLAREFRGRPTEAAALAFARPNRLKDRLVFLLDKTRSRRPLTRRGVVALSLGALVLTLLVSSLVPADTVALGVPAAATPETDVPEPMNAATDEASAASDAKPAQAPRARGIASAARPEEAAAPNDLPRVLDAFDRPAGISVAPQQATVLCGPADGEARRRSSSTNDDRRIIEAEFGDCRSTVRIEGDIEFSEDFSAVARMSSGALLRFEVDRDGSDRRLEARPGSGGRPDWDYTIDGRSQSFDGAAEAWLESALLELFRSSSYMAEERATWMLSEGGPEAVFDEIQLMLADHAQATYLAVLLDVGDLSPAQVRRAIEVAGNEIESDHSLGTVLIAAADLYPFDAATRTTFLEAATSIESDHTQGTIFHTALSRDDLSDSDLELLLRTAAGSIESDHTLGGVLEDLAGKYALEPRLREPFLQAAATLDSDHTAGRVYTVLLEQSGLREDELAAVLEAASTIESDHTLGEVLVHAAEGHDLSNAPLMDAFLRAASTIESDHTLSMTLIQIARMDRIGDREQVELLRTARGIGSDHSLAEFLVEFANQHDVSGSVRAAFEDTMNQIGSSHSRERVSAAIRR